MAERNDTFRTVRIQSIAEGNGQPLVFLHGWGIHAGGMRHVRAVLGKQFRTITPSLPGFGKSSAVPDGCTLEAYGDMLAAWLAKQALRDVVLVGHSFGGGVAQVLASKALAGTVQRLVLINSLGIPLHRSQASWQKALLASTKSTLRTGHLSLLAPAAASFIGNIFRKPKDLVRLAHLCEHFNSMAYAERIRVPTLVLWGRADELLPPKLGRRLARLIPGAAFKAVPGNHHWPMQRPEQLLGLLVGKRALSPVGWEHAAAPHR